MRARTGFSFPQLPALLLYALTIACEVPVILTRMLIALALSVLLLLITGHSTAGTEHLSELGLIPSLWAILALLTPVGGGWWWRQNLGGRRPSERERAAYEDSLELLRSHTSAPLPELRGWFVLDTPQPDAAVAGNTLMLSRGLLESDYLAPVLAHELGHLASTDGRLTAALNRLVIHPPRRTADEQIERRNGREAIMFAPDRVLLTLSASARSPGPSARRSASPKEDSACASPRPCGAPTGAHASTRRTATPRHSGRRTSWRTSSRSTRSSTTTPFRSSGSPNTPTRRPSCASTACAKPPTRCLPAPPRPASRQSTQASRGLRHERTAVNHGMPVCVSLRRTLSEPATTAAGTSSSGLRTCKGRPSGAACGGAWRPGLDRTRPLRWSVTHLGRARPAEVKATTDDDRHMRSLNLISKDGPGLVRSGAARLLGRARHASEERTFAPLLDAKAAGRLLGVPHTWLLAQARAGRIPHHRLGHYVRFDAEDLRHWLDQTRSGPQLDRPERDPGRWRAEE